MKTKLNLICNLFEEDCQNWHDYDWYVIDELSEIERTMSDNGKAFMSGLKVYFNQQIDKSIENIVENNTSLNKKQIKKIHDKLKEALQSTIDEEIEYIILNGKKKRNIHNFDLEFSEKKIQEMKNSQIKYLETKFKKVSLYYLNKSNTCIGAKIWGIFINHLIVWLGILTSIITISINWSKIVDFYLNIISKLSSLN